MMNLWMIITIILIMAPQSEGVNDKMPKRLVLQDRTDEHASGIRTSSVVGITQKDGYFWNIYNGVVYTVDDTDESGEATSRFTFTGSAGSEYIGITSTHIFVANGRYINAYAFDGGPYNAGNWVGEVDLGGTYTPVGAVNATDYLYVNGGDLYYYDISGAAGGLVDNTLNIVIDPASSDYQVIGGIFNSTANEYYFLFRDTLSNEYYCTVDVSDPNPANWTVTKTAINDITWLSGSEINYVRLWQLGSNYYTILQGGFYRSTDLINWSAVSEATTKSVGIIWDSADLTTDGYYANYVMFNNIYFKRLNDEYVRVYNYTGINSGSCGIETWIVDSTKDLAEFTLVTQTDISKLDISQGVYTSPTANMISETEPNDAEMYWLYDDYDNLIIIGQSEGLDYDGSDYNINLKSPISRDLMEKVSTTFTTQTLKQIREWLIDNKCLFLSYNSGITSSATTYTISFKNSSVISIIQWCDAQDGYVTSIRPDGEVFADQMTTGGESIFFTNDTNGAQPTDGVGLWTNESTAKAQVIASFGAQTKVLQITEVSSESNLNISQYDNKKQYHTVEFEFAFDSGSDNLSLAYVSACQNEDYTQVGAIIVFALVAGVVTPRLYDEDENLLDTGTTFNDDTWAKFKMVFNYATNKVTWYKDDVEQGADLSVSATLTNLNCISMGSTLTIRDAVFYVDDIDFEYNINDFVPKDGDIILSRNNIRYSKMILYGSWNSSTNERNSEIRLYEPGYGTYRDIFPRATAAQLSTMADNLESQKNQVINQLTIPVHGHIMYDYGQTIVVTNSQFNYSADTMYLNGIEYDALNSVCVLILTASLFVESNDYDTFYDKEVFDEKIDSINEMVDQNNGSGSSNSYWMPCIHEGTDQPGKVLFAGWRLSNVDSTDLFTFYKLPLPTNKGGLKLYVESMKVSVFDADANDYVNVFEVYGNDSQSGGATAATLINQEATNRTAAGEYETTFTATDCSSYVNVMAGLGLVCTTAAEVDIVDVSLKVYYA
jgi:hypothetical protein